jgi:hypothetical protein
MTGPAIVPPKEALNEMQPLFSLAREAKGET